MSNDNKKMKGDNAKHGSKGGESFWQMLARMLFPKKKQKKSGGPTQQERPECVVEGIPECPPPGSVSHASS
jgi:hypothetical protein